MSAVVTVPLVWQAPPVHHLDRKSFCTRHMQNKKNRQTWTSNIKHTADTLLEVSRTSSLCLLLDCLCPAWCCLSHCLSQSPATAPAAIAVAVVLRLGLAGCQVPHLLKGLGEGEEVGCPHWGSLDDGGRRWGVATVEVGWQQTCGTVSWVKTMVGVAVAGRAATMSGVKDLISLSPASVTLVTGGGKALKRNAALP